MPNAFLIESDVPHKPPVTNLYWTEGAHEFLLVTVVSVPLLSSILGDLGNYIPVARSHVETVVSVFLSDERGQVIDYDGNPANDLTPVLSTDSKSFAMSIVPDLINSDNPYVDALAALGYTLTEQEPTS
ncbi:DUF7572 family protein [Gordonia rubripertincta]|uniref:DUF7572 family protein n=1 Tax=Gordonia rubripertincta TaxID=36822 RepID=UPI0015FA2F81|nr:hypothetical protein [Gordonia rubripertincta]QMU19366.1 hypothetical protein H3V45_14835 [Gordonia rubripertincta]